MVPAHWVALCATSATGRMPNAFDADIELDYSQTSVSEGNNIAFDAMVNIPLGETTAVRALYSRIDNDGVIDYINAYQLNSFREPLIIRATDLR